MNLDKYTEKIDRYLQNRLLPEERKDFEDVLKESEELQQELRLREQEKQVIQEVIVKEYREKVGNWLPSMEELENESADNESDKSPRLRKIRPMYIRLVAAASVLILVAIGLRFWLDAGNSKEKLIAAYYIDPDSDLDQRIRSTDITISDSVYRQALKAYKEGDYQQVKSLLDPLADSDEQSLYLLANSHYQAKDFNRALKDFQKLAKQRGKFQEQAEYFQLLCYLEMDQLNEEFQSVLNMIIQSPHHSYQKKAESLKEDLNRI